MTCHLCACQRQSTIETGFFAKSESSRCPALVIRASNIDEKTVYYAGIGNVFLISKDGGKTFTNHVAGLDVYRIRDFDLSSDEKYIYAACGGAGIWVYSVNDDVWYEMNDAPVPYVNFTDVEFIDKEKCR